jgi:hypothetical protein
MGTILCKEELQAMILTRNRGIPPVRRRSQNPEKDSNRKEGLSGCSCFLICTGKPMPRD